MKIILNHSRQKFLFLFGITTLYIALVAWLDFLQGPLWWDEASFWETSLTFSYRLLPTLEDLQNYQELNTPLPFVVFGAVEHLFHQGIFGGRLLNLILSLSMVFMIGWPSRSKGSRGIVCLIGLFLCPYYLWLSGRLYTEMIACFWVLMGVVSYVHNRYLLSSIAFILAIASRQYMLAFPLAIATYEFVFAIAQSKKVGRIKLSNQGALLAPLFAVLSICGWFLLFQGLVPQTAIDVDKAPEIQETIWALTPGGAINFLSFVGCYIVIPELILFQPLTKLRLIRKNWRKNALIAVGLLLFFLFFPPLLEGSGNVIKVANVLPEQYKMLFFYVLSWLACARFFQGNLMCLVVLMNGLIMMKAYPWDRYVLPLAVVFWYLKSVDFDAANRQETVLP